MDEVQRRDGSFVVRIWWEQNSGQSQQTRVWRGWVQHARNGKQVYFQNLAALVLFIEQETGINADAQLPLEGIG